MSDRQDTSAISHYDAQRRTWWEPLALTLTASDEFLYSKGNARNNARGDVNVNAFMCYDGNRRGTVGIAYIRAACASDFSYRVNINEWRTSDSVTGDVRKQN